MTASQRSGETVMDDQHYLSNRGVFATPEGGTSASHTSYAHEVVPCVQNTVTEQETLGSHTQYGPWAGVSSREPPDKLLDWPFEYYFHDHQTLMVRRHQLPLYWCGSGQHSPTHPPSDYTNKQVMSRIFAPERDSLNERDSCWDFSRQPVER